MQPPFASVASSALCNAFAGLGAASYVMSVVGPMTPHSAPHRLQRLRQTHKSRLLTNPNRELGCITPATPPAIGSQYSGTSASLRMGVFKKDSTATKVTAQNVSSVSLSLCCENRAGYYAACFLQCLVSCTLGVIAGRRVYSWYRSCGICCTRS